MSEKKKIKMMFIGGEGARGDLRVGQIFELPEDWLDFKWFRAVEEKEEVKEEALKPGKVEQPEEAKITEKPPEQVIQEGEMKPKAPPTPLSQVKVLPPEELEKMSKKQLIEYLKSHGLETDPKLKKAQILQKTVSLYTPSEQ